MCRSDNNISMDIKEMSVGVDWVSLAQNVLSLWAIVNMVTDLQVSQKAGSFFS
jgi:hypothetical protein